MRKRVLSLLLSVCMVLVLFPMVSFADGNYTVVGRTATLTVNDVASLKSALNDSGVDEVVIGAAITLPDGTSLDGGGKTVRVPSPYVHEDGVWNVSPSNFRVFDVENGSEVSISNMTIMGGYVSSDGGGIASYGNINLENVTFTRSNRGLMEYEGEAVLKNCNFVMNIRESAGAIWCGGGAKVVLDGCSFTNNHSSGNGSNGGGAIGVSGGSLYANNTVFANNATGEIGGAINLYNGNAYLINCTFTGNVTNSGVTYGGAIGNNGGNLYAANCIFVDNYASITGSLERSDVGNYNSANSLLINCLYGTTNVPSEKIITCKTDTENETAFSYVDTGVTLRDGSPSVPFTHPDLASGTNAYAKYVPVNATGPAITGGIATYFDYSDLSAIKMGYGAPESITAFSGLTPPDSSMKVTTCFEGCIRSDGVIGASAPKAKYTVTFDANGGSVTPTSAGAGTDGKLATLPTPTRSGYSFVGWYTAAIGGIKITAEKVYTADTALYAHWAPLSFADLPETGVTNITVPEGDCDTEVAVKDAFILFWNENINTDGEFELVDCFNVDVNGYHAWCITIENDVTSIVNDGYATDLDTILGAINNPNTTFDWWVNGTYSAIHTVTVQNDGNGTASADKSSAAKGDTVTLTATPNTGYHFKKWQSSDVTVSGDAFTMPEKNVTVKAVFEADAPTTYTVTFNMNGHGTQVADQTVEDGNKATKPADPKASGYTFGGWYADATFSTKFDFNSDITEDTVLYAKWTPSATVPSPVPNLVYNESGTPVILGQKKSYGWLEGQYQTISSGAESAVFRADADFSKFQCAYVDGIKLTPSQYRAYSGSTIVELNGSYIRSLKAGSHTLRMQFEDGYSETTFYVGNEENPDTGAPAAAWGILEAAVISAAVIFKKH